jgi:predicted NBD/HSP70 family sugar kinase
MPIAGIEVPEDMPFAERLLLVQGLMAAGDERARRVFETIGTYFGYGIAQYADFYELRHVSVMGRVTSGAGRRCDSHRSPACFGERVPRTRARSTALASEQEKRHGQAAAAATLPALRETIDGTPQFRIQTFSFPMAQPSISRWSAPRT